MKTNHETIAKENYPPIEEMVMEFLNKTIKTKVVSLERNVKTAVERIVKEIKV